MQQQEVPPQPAPDRLFSAFEQSITWEDDIWRADPVDVAEVHAKARRKFSDLLTGIISGRGPGTQDRILLFHGQSGAGKTHLLRALRTTAHRAGTAYFGYAQMTPDVANYADYYLRRLVHSLEKTYDPDSSGESALTRLTGRLVADAAVDRQGPAEPARSEPRRGQARQARAQDRRRYRRQPQVRQAGPRHQRRARHALPGAPRSAHRPAHPPIPARPPAHRACASGRRRTRPEHRRGPRLRDHRRLRRADVDRRARRARVLRRSGRGPALLLRRRGALPARRARSHPDRQPGAERHSHHLVPGRLLRPGARRARAVVHRPHREGRTGRAARKPHAGRSQAHHRQAPGASRRDGRRQKRVFGSVRVLRPAVLRGVRRPLDAALCSSTRTTACAPRPRPKRTSPTREPRPRRADSSRASRPRSASALRATTRQRWKRRPTIANPGSGSRTPPRRKSPPTNASCSTFSPAASRSPRRNGPAPSC